MKQTVHQFYTISRLTLLEAMRQPLSLLLLTACVVMIGLLPHLITHTLGGAEKLVRDSALAVHLVVGLLLGGTAACSTLVREIRSGTASTVLSKPVSRALFLLAKFAGVAALTILFSVAAILATLLSTRVAAEMDDFAVPGVLLSTSLFWGVLLAYAYGGWVNYVWRRPFNSAAFSALLMALLLATMLVCLFSPASGGAPLSSSLPLEIIPAGALVGIAIVMLAAIAVSLAPRLELAPTIAVCAVVLMMGLVSDYCLGRSIAAGQMWAWVPYALVPNWQHFWVVDALGGHGTISVGYIIQVALYTSAYCMGVLSLGVLAFTNMELR